MWNEESNKHCNYTFAEKQNDFHGLCSAINKVTNITVLIILPGAVVAALYGKVILSIVYRPEFSVLALSFAALCLYMVLRLEGIILASALFAIGQPGKHRFFVGLRFVLLVMIIYPFITSLYSFREIKSSTNGKIVCTSLPI